MSIAKFLRFGKVAKLTLYIYEYNMFNVREIYGKYNFPFNIKKPTTKPSFVVLDGLVCLKQHTKNCCNFQV